MNPKPQADAPIPEAQPWITDEDVSAMTASAASGWVTEGPRTEAFAERLLALLGARYGVFAPNGTLALTLGLHAIGALNTYEVLVPDITFIASATAGKLINANPVFVDVHPDTGQIKVEDAERKVTTWTRAIMPVHLYGSCADMDAVMAFAAKHNLLVIEDAAQALGVRYRGRCAGTFGTVGCFSFFADKSITTGEGGFVVTNDEEIYRRLRFLRNQGRENRGSFVHPSIGYNFRITDFQAALGLSQLNRLDDIIARKKAIDAQYRAGLAGIAGLSFLDITPGSEHVPFRTVIRCRDPHGLRDHLASKQIGSRTAFYPLHRQPAFQYLAPADDAAFPGSTAIYDQCAGLPCFPQMTESQVTRVCEEVRAFLSHSIHLS